MISRVKLLVQRSKFIKPSALVYWNLLMKNVCAGNWNSGLFPSKDKKNFPLNIKVSNWIAAIGSI